MLEVDTTYISSNCNQTPTAADWGNNNKVCYASCNSVFIYDPQFGTGGKVVKTLSKHTGRVNSVKWIKGKSKIIENELVSGSADGTAIVWSLSKGDSAVVLKAHESNVNIVDGLYKDYDTCPIIITASMDNTVKIWLRKDNEYVFSLMQSLSFGYSVAVGLRLYFLTDSELILACALDNSNVQLYVESQQGNFEDGAILSGHEDWVRGLDFTRDNKNDILLATCSQDNFVRLWRIALREKTNNSDISQSFIINHPQISTENQTYNIYLESILSGHEGWVYSVNWNSNCLQLLSSSLDKTMIIWEFDEYTGLWMEKMRVGEVGGNSLGFYGGIFNPDGSQILAYSYHGAFHIWNRNSKDEWTSSVTVGGHFKEVTDLAWEPHGEFLYTVSADQTTRIHAPWPRHNVEPVTWHEIARPQVHGYDISSIAVLSRYKFASGAEEKVVRTFEAPKTFVENFRRICCVMTDEEGDKIITSTQITPKGAAVPSLGLSNKAVFTDDNKDCAESIDKKSPYPEESHFVAEVLTVPPTEETLLQNTLWPEIQKLYGHGYEIICLAASPDGKLLASACKSAKSEHAAIILWDTQNWQQIQKLFSHTLTVVQMQFSPNGQCLLSVSRDRRWTIFVRKEDGLFSNIMASAEKRTTIHSRIIWTCSWTHDSMYFATGSRDGKVVVWRNDYEQNSIGKFEPASEPLHVQNASVTAVAFAPQLIKDSSYLISVGFESGNIDLYLWNIMGWNHTLSLNQSVAHHLAVKRLAFRPICGRAGYKNREENVCQLASCSSDHSVRIFDIFCK